jgi:hypothetical protein
MFKFFNGINSISELKKALYKLAKINHPDLGGNLETMQEINNEYDVVFNSIHKGINFEDKTRAENRDTYKTETSDIFKDIIEKIIHFDNVEIEICGYWLYIHGDTKPYKELLKTNGFYWSAKKVCWYWRPEWASAKFNKKTHSMEEIRGMYGSEKIESKPFQKINR